MKKSIFATLALFAASTIVPAVADDFGHPANNEAGSCYYGPEYRFVEGHLARTDSASATRATPGRADPNWTFVGGETGWALTPHAYALKAGHVVHADTFRHDSPKPSVAHARSNDPYSDKLYAGG